ncbi:MAG: hypothetical protein O2855_08935 [Planctomycetota bacterium]|nr:hypothetical protein [Planctomycetota bacterium]
MSAPLSLDWSVRHRTATALRREGEVTLFDGAHRLARVGAKYCLHADWDDGRIVIAMPAVAWPERRRGNPAASLPLGDDGMLTLKEEPNGLVLEACLPAAERTWHRPEIQVIRDRLDAAHAVLLKLADEARTAAATAAGSAKRPPRGRAA